ncbi:MAG: hypothetical protein ABFS18_08175 [Thermodesulfobacteriota bacterium]
MKYKKGKQDFMENFLLTRNKALNEAEAALADGGVLVTVAIAGQAELSAEARGKYADKWRFFQPGLLPVIHHCYSCQVPLSLHSNAICSSYNN